MSTLKYRILLLTFILIGDTLFLMGKSFGERIVESWSRSTMILLEGDQFGRNESFSFFPPPVALISVSVSANSDDAEENLSSGAVTLSSSDLELINDGVDQIVGMRFQSIGIPQGAYVYNAYIEFEVDETSSTPTDLVIRGEDIGDAPTFTTSTNNISSRDQTFASVAWDSVDPWDTAGDFHQTPDISTVIQEIVNRGDWSSGNDMVILIEGSGERTAESYEGNASGAARLVIDYGDAHVEICNNGIDDDGDGLIDCNDPDCGGAVAVLTSTGIGTPENALGAADGAFVEIYDIDDLLTLDLGLEIPQGHVYSLVWRRKSSYTDDLSAEVILEESSDNISWTTHPTNPGVISKTDFVVTDVVANVNTRFLRISTLTSSGDDIDFDAVIFDCAVEICDNGIDDDGDGLVDANDPDCSACQTQTISVRVNASSDDAEEDLSDNSVDLSSSDLELADEGSNNQRVGVRFNNINIPPDAIITNAYLEFETDVSWDSPCNLTLRGQADSNPGTFTSANSNLTGRPSTIESVPWNPGAWNTVNEKHTTPNLQAIVQELIDLSGWASGNSMVFFIEGTGTRESESYDGEQNAAPLLVVEFEECREICNNGMDDDYDGLTDCEDSDCPCSTLLNLSMCREPDITSGFITVNYDAAFNAFTASGYAVSLDSVGAGAAVSISSGSFNITSNIDETGAAIGGTLVINGNVSTYSGNLLSGSIAEFGYMKGGGGLFEFIFTVTGGQMAEEYGGIGNRVGVILSQVSNFNGDWNVSFNDSSFNAIADTAPENCPVGGQVRSDMDNDGDLADSDPGITGVTVFLYDDPECDGIPNNVVSTLTTDGNGQYYFPNVSEGCYVLQELDLTSYTSTNDKDLVNDNFVAVSMPELSAYPTLDNDFLDYISLDEVCNNGIDDDLDGLTDCADPDCNVPSITNVNSSSPANCPDLNDGQIIITATGVNLEYSIDGGSTFQTSNSFTGLSAGSYNVRVRNSISGCFINDANNPYTLNEPTCIEICDNGIDDDGDGFMDCEDPECGPSVFAGTDVNLCAGSSTTISANGSDGEEPYTFIWDNALGNGASHTVSPLVSTTYTVTISDANNCTATDQVRVFITACVEVCADGLDNDGDGLVDCDDPDCLATGKPNPLFDSYVSCPGVVFTEQVIFNDDNLQSPTFSIYQNTTTGSVSINNDGVFTFSPNNSACGSDHFIYEVCNQVTGCCDTASVFLTKGDADPPVLQNIPADITIGCDESLPDHANLVYALDACPGIYISYEEESTQVNAAYCQNYTITRTWRAIDLCGNEGIGQQIITVRDVVEPELFRLYTLSNGKKIVGGVADRTTNQWKYIEFPINFSSVPLVFAQVISENDPAAVNARLRNVNEEGFEMRLQEEENADGVHEAEEVAWIAIEEGDLSDGSLQTILSQNINSSFTTIDFSTSFSGLPAILASPQTYHESDPFALRHRNLSGASVELLAEEELSYDTETDHANEDVGILAMNVGTLFDEDDIFVGESGAINIDEDWITVELARLYNKPVIVFGSASSGQGPAFVRVRNVTSSSFEVHLKEWDYQDGNHPNETVSFFVIEGSIPAVPDYYCSENAVDMEPGINLFATDNCDNHIAFEYSDSSEFRPTGLHIIRDWSARDDCGNSVYVSRTDTCTIAGMRINAFLFGPMLNNNGSSMMRSDLNTKGIIPLEEPYSEDGAFYHVGSGGGETATEEVLAQSLGDAIVDWVFLEVRDGDDFGNVLGTCSALLQRDGDIVTAAGEDVIYFPGLTEGNYYISIRHRNHLGIMTGRVAYLSTYEVPDVDFRLSNFNFNGLDQATRPIPNGSRAMWVGDLNGDGRVIFQGPQNDVFEMFSLVLTAEENDNHLANYIMEGYYKEDLNMDGLAIYQGPNNDRATLLYHTVLAHPSNSSMLANYIVKEWLP